MQRIRSVYQCFYVPYALRPIAYGISTYNQNYQDKLSVCHCCVCVLVHQMTKSVTCPDELGGLASHVTADYSQLATQGRLAAHTAEPEEVRTVVTGLSSDIFS